MAEDAESGEHQIVMKTWAERDENEYALLLEESFTVLIEKIDAIVEEEIDIDAILADLLV